MLVARENWRTIVDTQGTAHARNKPLSIYLYIFHKFILHSYSDTVSQTGKVCVFDVEMRKKKILAKLYLR